GHEHAGRIVTRKLGSLVGPGERGERPQRRGKPGVEHVLVAPERHALRRLIGAEAYMGKALVMSSDEDDVTVVIISRLSQRLGFALCDEDFHARERERLSVQFPSVPGRDLVTPPELARYAPGLNVFHPV